MSKSRAARRRGQKNKKTSHNVDVHILFNGAWFDSIDDAQFHIERIASQTGAFPAMRSSGLTFQAHRIQKGSKEQVEIFPQGEMIGFFFSQAVSDLQERIVRTTAVSYFEGIVEGARNEMQSAAQQHLPTQETHAQETRDHLQSSDTDQSSGSLP